MATDDIQSDSTQGITVTYVLVRKQFFTQQLEGNAIIWQTNLSTSLTFKRPVKALQFA